MTVTQVQTLRASAGERYARAVEELRGAYIDLAGIDGALSNSAFRSGGPPLTFTPANIDHLPLELCHPDFADHDSNTAGWRARIDERAAWLVRRYSAKVEV